MALDASGVEWRVFSDTRGGIWAPLAQTSFAESIVDIGGNSGRRGLLSMLSDFDVVYAAKPQAGSLGVAHRSARRANLPLVVDIDDGDALQEATPMLGRLGFGRWNEMIRAKSVFPRWKMRTLVGRLGSAVTVSNPELQRLFGGTLVPHVRQSRPFQASPREATVAFVGTHRSHKGVAVLRQAVARLSSHGVRLVISGDRPADAHPWESWLGLVGFDEVIRVYERSAVMAVPQLDTPFARLQFPVKMLDGLLAGCRVLASDLPVLRWVGDGFASFAIPGDVDSWTSAIGEALSISYDHPRAVDQAEMVAGRFSPSVVGSELAGVLERVCGSEAPRV